MDFIQVWNSMEVCKWWQNCHLSVKLSFKKMQHSVLVFLLFFSHFAILLRCSREIFLIHLYLYLGLCVFIFFKPLCLTQTIFSFVPLPDPIILCYFSYLISKPNIQFLSTINSIAPCLALSLFVDLELAKLENISFFFFNISFQLNPLFPSHFLRNAINLVLQSCTMAHININRKSLLLSDDIAIKCLWNCHSDCN